MSVRLTITEGKCALYDSTNNMAFGPVFDSELAAEGFLEWLILSEREERTLLVPGDRLYVKADPRLFRADELQRLKGWYESETVEENA